MKTQVTFRHVSGHHPNLQEMAIQEAEQFKKYHDGIISTHVEFINESDKVVLFTVHLQGATLVAKEESDDFKKSLSSAADKIVRQIQKLKTKVQSARVKPVVVAL